MRFARWWYVLPLRLRSLFRRNQVERELDLELRYHLERQTDEFIAQGMEPARARAKAVAALGGVELRKEECRDTRKVSLVEHLIRDIRYGLRALRRNAGFAAIAILTLTLGIGANTAIFTVVNSVLIRPLAYRDPGRIVAVPGTVAPATFLEVQARARSFERMALTEWWTSSLASREGAQSVEGIRLTASLLPLLGVEPLLGRIFRPEEEHSGRERVVILRYQSWQTRFGADPAIIGRTILLDGEPYTVIGVMPPSFEFVPFWADQAEMAAPLVLDRRRDDRSGSSLRIFARLAQGASLEQARAELNTVMATIEKQFPGTTEPATVVRAHDIVVEDVKPALLILAAAVALVLLIASANAAHLQLVRATAREREFAVRTALGGSRTRLVQQSLVESGILALAGGVLGLLLALVGVRSLVALSAGNIPRLDQVSIDARVLGFTLAVTLLAGIGSGLIPALTAARVDLHGSLKEGGRSAADSLRRKRTRSVLVVSEFAMALMLLIGAGLVIRSFAARLSIDAGFDPKNILSMIISVQATEDDQPERRVAFFRQLVDRVADLPGVELASAINHLPLHGDNWHLPYAVEGKPPTLTRDQPKAMFRVIRPGYFRTMRIPLVKGRDFTTGDEEAGARVTIVNRFLAERHWPGQDPIGRRIRVGNAGDWFTVIGVTSDVKQDSWVGGPAGEMYYPELSTRPLPDHRPSLLGLLNPEAMTLVIRAGSDPDHLTRTIRSVVAEINPGAPVSDVITMEAAIANQFAGPRFHLLVLVSFAALALALAAVGIYGVMHYTVARRAHEIGVRLALGAGRGKAFALVVRQAMVLAAIGGLIGLALAFGLTRFLRTLLYGVEPTDPSTFVVVSLILGLVAFVASSVPGWRASKVDPVTALRSE